MSDDERGNEPFCIEAGQHQQPHRHIADVCTAVILFMALVKGELNVIGQCMGPPLEFQEQTTWLELRRRYFIATS
jgi:hypothetical protein